MVVTKVRYDGFEPVDCLQRRKRFEETQAKTENLITSRFDENVRQVFKGIQAKLPLTLVELDRDVDKLVAGYLDACGAQYQRSRQKNRTIFEIAPNGVLPAGLSEGGRYLVGEARDAGDIESLHIGHPLVHAAVDEARNATEKRFQVRFALDRKTDVSLVRHLGKRGRMVVTKVRYDGFEPVDRLLVTALIEGDSTPLPQQDAELLLDKTITDAEVTSRVDPQAIDDAIEEQLFFDQAVVAEEEQQRFERAIEQIERYADDRVLVLKREHESAMNRFRAAEARRDSACSDEISVDKAEADLARISEELESLEARIEQFRNRDDDDYRKSHERANQRRFSQPRVGRLLDVEFEIA